MAGLQQNPRNPVTETIEKILRRAQERMKSVTSISNGCSAKHIFSMIDDLKQCITERTNQTALWQLTTPFQYKIIKDMEWKEYQYKKIKDTEWKESTMPLQNIGGI